MNQRLQQKEEATRVTKPGLQLKHSITTEAISQPKQTPFIESIPKKDLSIFIQITTDAI